MEMLMYSDGGSRGNPGPSAIGAVVYDASTGQILGEVSEYIGVTTNNQAEYRAVIAGLKLAKELGATAVDCRMDSMLVVKQMRREWKIKEQSLAPLVLEIHNLSVQIGRVAFYHVPREQNQHADALVNKALDAEIARKG